MLLLPCCGAGARAMSAEIRVLKTATKKFGREPGPVRDEAGSVAPLPSVAPDLDHAQVEALMASMSKADRATFWRRHVDLIGRALSEQGVRAEVVEVVLRNHLERVRKIHASRKDAAKRARARCGIDFEEPPEVGTVISFRGKMAVLLSVDPYLRKTDGRESFLLTWDVEGRRGTSGLRANGLYWVDPEPQP